MLDAELVELSDSFGAYNNDKNGYVGRDEVSGV
jgi:hypothetical protein